MRLIVLLTALILWAQGVAAFDLRIATITRPPFSMEEDGQATGFSIDLWQALARDIGAHATFERATQFPAMLDQVQNGDVDAAIANISITARREVVMDFSQPIFESGLQIMIPAEDNSSSSAMWTALFSGDLLIAILLAFALLFGGGMLMWWLERHRQDYFNLPAKDAMFPAFWWALNLVVNGGFEERQPRSPLGRALGVFLVVSSLFIVSVFVAKITAAMTISAIQTSVTSVNDLYGKNNGTIADSTAAIFLDARNLNYTGYPDLVTLLADFENGTLDAVVFDAPILAWYANSKAGKNAQMVGPVFMRENYGIALPSGSELAERINQSLLKLREDGTYDRIYSKWFGTALR
jgi:polar amino acid transport system substrate-binding protein